MKIITSCVFVVAFIFSVAPFVYSQDESVLFVVDIDGTLGEQSKSVPEFFDGNIASIPHDTFGDFYFFPGALDFMNTILTPQFLGPTVHVALFTMGSGPRNEIIRDYVAHKLGIDTSKLNVFDYSEAVFSKEIVDKWRQNDPSLSASTSEYFDSLDKPIKHVAQLSQFYVKDLSKLLPYYPGLKLKNIVIFDDNSRVVPVEQSTQLIVAKPETGYAHAVDRFLALLQSVKD